MVPRVRRHWFEEQQVVQQVGAREIGRVAAKLVSEHIDEPTAHASLARRVVIPTKVIDYRNVAR